MLGGWEDTTLQYKFRLRLQKAGIDNSIWKKSLVRLNFCLSM